jgi:glucose uptake protein GlcU
MKKAGISCIVVAVMGFIIYSFKMSVIGYYGDEKTLLSVIGFMLVALVIIGVILNRMGAAQDKREAEEKLRKKWGTSQQGKDD